jgi:tripartite-type tricarboxylate transporter receptor subunit TctC
VRQRLAQQGAEPAPDTPQAFAAYIQAEYAKWDRVIRALNIRLE